MYILSLANIGFIKAEYIEIAFPIVLGFLISFIIYIVCRKNQKTKREASKIILRTSLIAALSSVTIGSLVLGGFPAMWFGVVALGMLLAAIVSSLLNY